MAGCCLTFNTSGKIDCSAIQQEFLGQCSFTCIRMGNNGKCSSFSISFVYLDTFSLLLRFFIIVCIKHRQQPVSVTFSIFLQHSYSSICTSFLSRYMFAYSYQNISHKYQLYRLRYPHMAVLMFRCLPHTKYLLMFHLSVLYLLHLHSPSVG